ncbi:MULTISPECIES: hypothetical protein [Shewanella]|jgi:hypothetical protein|uniref:hypothetical protein n=2 Tax=Shewanellaceae TaxID=267890 RepID=UPI000D362275|nr:MULTISPECIES: hypothetical protein [Shewanella]EGT3628122.1 hypothetical protein [Morganella morganii]RBP80261.1 hypothetical protein DET47_10588 [Shewanella putrefaciens]MBP6519510.1 hypothetical protein [Shewanella sp.]MBW3529923.1 hypothetical protein [Shewanella sp. NKUCC06_TVS]MCI2963247.1 hypothetical protein [Shewanella sp. N2AIL]
MFFTLLLITFALSITVSFLVVSIFKRPLGEIFSRIIQDSISAAWQKYIIFATYVVGISGGVRIYDLERYITARHKDVEILQLTLERWTIEIYRTIIETLQSIAWMYLIVFIFALIAYVIVRGFELKNANKQ